MQKTVKYECAPQIRGKKSPTKVFRSMNRLSFPGLYILFSSRFTKKKKKQKAPNPLSPLPPPPFSPSPFLPLPLPPFLPPPTTKKKPPRLLTQTPNPHPAPPPPILMPVPVPPPPTLRVPTPAQNPRHHRLQLSEEDQIVRPHLATRSAVPGSWERAVRDRGRGRRGVSDDEVGFFGPARRGPEFFGEEGARVGVEDVGFVEVGGACGAGGDV